MADTQARIGHGGTFELAYASAPTAFTYIAETRDFTLPNESTGTDDATHMQSPNRVQEFIDTLTDPGEVSFDMNLVPGSASDQFLMACRGKRMLWRYTFPSGHQFLGYGVRTGYEKSAPAAGRMEASVTFKVSGEPDMTEPTAPRNLVAPTITGTAQVGVPLVADPGIWAGAMSLSYQWEAGGVEIAGATNTTYVPVVGDVGDPITCVVTGVNDDFETEVETDATANVIAAA
jgi:hypothetical protein